MPHEDDEESDLPTGEKAMVAIYFALGYSAVIVIMISGIFVFYEFWPIVYDFFRDKILHVAHVPRGV